MHRVPVRLRLRTPTICLILGAALTMATAWSLAAWMPLTRARERLRSPDWAWHAWNEEGYAVLGGELVSPGGVRRGWRLDHISSFPTGFFRTARVPFGETRRAHLSLAAWGGFDAVPWRPDCGPTHCLEDARGWPALALWCGLSRESDEWAAPGGIVLTPDVSTSRLASVRALPCRPIWSGLAANAAFYAIFTWVILFAPFTVRRAWRRRRGRCARCNYDLAGLSRCPECGTRE